MIARLIAGFALLILMSTSSAVGAPFVVDFEVKNFTLLLGSGSPPDDPVSGEIVYEAATINSSIDSITSIDLTIDGHTYSVGEIGGTTDMGFQLVGGTVNGVPDVFVNTNDFALSWNFTTLAPGSFDYASASAPNQNGVWFSSTFESFSVQPVPEPSSLSLVALGAIGLGITAVRRRRRTKNSLA